jgi:photosystem II stability/assembly factor-like uncharacterized protein
MILEMLEDRLCPSAWTSIGPAGAGVWRIAVAPSDPETVYAGTFGGVYKSTDAGANWSDVSNDLGSHVIWSVAVDPGDANTVYAASEDVQTGNNGIYKTTDGGTSWVHVLSGALANVVRLDPQHPNTVYACAGGGAYSSIDAGGTWSLILPGYFVRDIAFDPADSQRLYAATFSGVFKSTDGGLNWSPAGLTGQFLPTLAVAANADGSLTLYAGTLATGLYRSNDGGATWCPTGLAATSIVYVGVDPAHSGTVYAGTGQGAFRSTDGGATWQGLNDGLNPQVLGLALDPLNADHLYAGTSIGLFQTTDGGSHWSETATGLAECPCHWIYAVAVDPRDSTLYASTDEAGMFKSSDGGKTWVQLPIGRSPSIIGITLDPQDPDTIYAGSIGGGVYKSTDAGASWSQTGLPNATAWMVEVDPSDSNILYVALGNGSPYRFGVFKSVDGGVNWSDVLPLSGVDTLWVAIDPGDPNVVLAGAAGGIYRSADSGQTWNEVHTSAGQVPQIAFDPQDSSTVYYAATGSDGGVYKSTDAGDSWQRTGLGIPMRAVAIDPQQSNRLYAGTSNAAGSGVYVSNDGGDSWEALNDGLTNSKVYSALAVDPNTPDIVYAGTQGGSVFRLDQSAGSRSTPSAQHRLPTHSHWQTASPALGAPLPHNHVSPFESAAPLWTDPMMVRLSPDESLLNHPRVTATPRGSSVGFPEIPRGFDQVFADLFADPLSPFPLTGR